MESTGGNKYDSIVMRGTGPNVIGNQYIRYDGTQQRAEDTLTDLLRPGTNPTLSKKLVQQEYGRPKQGAFPRFFGQDSSFKQITKPSGGKVLWIIDKDDSGRGSPVLVSSALDQFPQPSNVSFFFCRKDKPGSNNTLSVLRGLINGLVQGQEGLLRQLENLDSVRHQYRDDSRDKKEIIQDEVGILGDVLGSILNNLLTTHPNYLIVSKIDECLDFEQLLEILVDCLGTSSATTTLIITSKQNSNIRGQCLLSNEPWELYNLTAKEVCEALSLEEVVKAVEKTAKDFQPKPVSAHTGSQEEYSWLKYTHQGQGWINLNSGASRTLCYKSDTNTDGFTNLGHHVSNIITESQSTVESMGVFVHSHVSLRNLNLKTGDCTQCLWPLFAQLAYQDGKGISDESYLYSLLLRVKSSLRSTIQKLCAKVTKSGSLSIMDHTFLSPLLALLEIAISLTAPSNPIIIILESAHLATRLSAWRDLFQGLQKMVSDPRNNCRLLISGTSWPGNTIGIDEQLVKYPDWVFEETEYTECRDSLNFERMDSRRSQISKPLAGTNEWIWTYKDFTTWISEGGLFWVAGNPGCGKSVLAKTVYSYFMNLKTRDGAQIHVCDWFYSARGHAAGTSHVQMLKAILYRFLGSGLESFAAIRPVYRRRIDAGRGTESWTESELVEGLKSASTLPYPCNAKFFFLIDAIDESDDTGSSRRDIVRTLSGPLASPQSPDSTRIWVMFLSRLGQPGFGVSDYHLLTLHKENTPDVELTIDAKLNDLENILTSPMGIHSSRGLATTGCQLRDGMLTMIRRFLKEHARGILLWVLLVAERLIHDCQSNKTLMTCERIQEILNRTPVGIDDLYKRILIDLNLEAVPERLATSRAILAWCLGTRSGDALQLQDLLDALAIPNKVLDTGDAKEEPLPFHMGQHFQIMIGDWDKFRNFIYEHVGPLVEIHALSRSKDNPHVAVHQTSTHPEATVGLIHQTVKTFLQDESRSGCLHMTVETATEFVVAKSINHLRLCLPFCQRKNYPPNTFFGPISKQDASMDSVAQALDSRPYLRNALKLWKRHEYTGRPDWWEWENINLGAKELEETGTLAQWIFLHPGHTQSQDIIIRIATIACARGYTICLDILFEAIPLMGEALNIPTLKSIAQGVFTASSQLLEVILEQEGLPTSRIESYPFRGEPGGEKTPIPICVIGRLYWLTQCSNIYVTLAEASGQMAYMGGSPWGCLWVKDIAETGVVLITSELQPDIRCLVGVSTPDDLDMKFEPRDHKPLIPLGPTGRPIFSDSAISPDISRIPDRHLQLYLGLIHAVNRFSSLNKYGKLKFPHSMRQEGAWYKVDHGDEPVIWIDSQFILNPGFEDMCSDSEISRNRTFGRSSSILE